MTDETPADPGDAADETEDLPQQMLVRRDKLERLRELGRDPYPVSVPRTANIADLRNEWSHLEADQSTGSIVSVTGRVIFVRNAGKLCFATLREGSGAQIQAMLSLDVVGEDPLAHWKTLVDLGDHVSVTGEVISSRRGELSILASEWAMAAKSLRPLPVEHKPMNEETRVRRRYVDLIVREEARAMVRTRATTNRSLRTSLDSRGFTEVETPMLQTIQGGATARPFKTHINAYDAELYLRIAPELFLKRAVVGGIEKVFELNRNFRNEGADSTHSPEFAMLEVYEAYGDYNTMATLTRELIQEAAVAVFGSTEVTQADGTVHDFGGQWREIKLYDAVSEVVGESVTPSATVEFLTAIAGKVDLGVNPDWGHGKLVEQLFEHLVEPTLITPTFVRDFPIETTPLTRSHRSEPGVTEKWDLVVQGFELATAYSELVDPLVQRERLQAQAMLAAAGDDEAMLVDEEFLEALEYAMPPSGGMGMGLDRLLCAFTGRGIRDTILFPFIKPL